MPAAIAACNTTATSAFILDNSVWDAQTYSVTGNQVAKPAYANARATMMFGGPLKIPHLLSGQRGMFTLNYQLTAAATARPRPSTMPTALERAGEFLAIVRAGAGDHLRPAHGQSIPGQCDPAEPRSPRCP